MFLAMEDRWVGIVAIALPTNLVASQIDRNGLRQLRMGDFMKLRVGEEGQLEFIRWNFSTLNSSGSSKAASTCWISASSSPPSDTPSSRKTYFAFGSTFSESNPGNQIFVVIELHCGSVAFSVAEQGGHSKRVKAGRTEGRGSNSNERQLVKQSESNRLGV